MEFKKLDTSKHDLNKVSMLIYETELELVQSLFGKNQKKAQENIKKLIYTGENSFGHDKIYVVTGENEDVLGIMVSYLGDEIKVSKDIKAFLKAMNIIEFLKLALIGSMLSKLLLADIKRDDYYLSNISVDKTHRSKGIGSFMLEKSSELARNKRASRLILDVNIDNERALRLYERFGFRVYDKKSIKWFGEEIGIFSMEKIL